MNIPDGDVLVHAGDATSTGTAEEVERFLQWFDVQPHARRLFIAGNHDWLFQRQPDLAAMMLAEHPGITYLQDEQVEIAGIRFYGSPWQPEFNQWAFNLPRRGHAIRAVWARVPQGTDVLITHGPPHGILDQVRGGTHLGCEALAERVAAVKPRIHVFGHIHDGFGVVQSTSTLFINASLCDEDYLPINRPVVVDLLPDRIEVTGIVATTQKRDLDTFVTMLTAAQSAPTAARSGHIHAALEAMADLRGVTATILAEEYLVRGLQADAAKMIRKEGKPSRRPIPFQERTQEDGPDGA
jgi:predicted phosphohydrolase